MNGLFDDNEFVSTEPLEQTYKLKRKDEKASDAMLLWGGIAMMSIYIGLFVGIYFMVNK
jgi:hypothetical protein